jgi:hypothetical protein
MTNDNLDDNLVLENNSSANALVDLGFSEEDSEFTNYTIFNKSFSNFSALQDYNELVEWGNQGYGLEIGPPTNDAFVRVASSVGSNIMNAIHLNWGEGIQKDMIHTFINNGVDLTGEVGISFRLSIPPNVKVGKRQFSIAVFYTY